MAPRRSGEIEAISRRPVRKAPNTVAACNVHPLPGNGEGGRRGGPSAGRLMRVFSGKVMILKRVNNVRREAPSDRAIFVSGAWAGRRWQMAAAGRRARGDKWQELIADMRREM